MSEETPPAKKAARKTVRKKSATKRAPRKSAKSTSESDQVDEQLPLADGGSVPSGPESSLNPDTQEDVKLAKQGREPRSGVRDARRETAGDPIPGEVTEKLVPSEDLEKESADIDSGEKGNSEKASGERPRQKNRKEPRENPEDSQRDQGERRGRGRGRGGRDRQEKREPKQRIQVDAKDLAKKAWKIFESEVTEEGLALLDDNGLRDYARSSFNAARLFLEEKGRVVGRGNTDKSDKEKPEKGDD